MATENATRLRSRMRAHYVLLQKISILPLRIVVCFDPPPPPHIHTHTPPSENSSLVSYFPLKNWPLRPPSPSEFPMTILGVGMDIFWNHIIIRGFIEKGQK